MPGIQAKLEVSQPDDPSEQEADRVAEQVMRMPAQEAPTRPETPALMRKENRAPGTQGVSSEVGSVLGNGSGQPLDAATRAFMEPRFGYDFGGVQIHTNEQAARSAQALHARAYTFGKDVVFGAGQYQPETSEGQRLIAHELTHVVQASDKHSDSASSSAPVSTLEHEAEQAATHISQGHSVGPTTRLAQNITAPLLDSSEGKKDDTPPNPLASWQLSQNSLLLLHSEDRLFIIPGSHLVWVPDAESQRQFAASRGHFVTDLGALFEVPATGASGTRVFRAGTRSAVLIDAGSDPSPGGGIPAAVYMNQLQGVMANLGLTNVARLQLIHVHADHVSETPEVVARLNIRAENVLIPAPFIGTNQAIRRVVTALQTTTDPNLTNAGFGSGWRPGTVMRDRGGPGDIFRYSYRIGELVIENLALRSALTNVAGNPDLASYLTKVTRTTDDAKVVILGDLRGRDLTTIRNAMEVQRPGSWNEFFSGVTTLSGFSHHAGRMEDRDVDGMMSLLDATMLRTGRLRVVEQTNVSATGAQRARADTLELLGRVGAEVAVADMPAPGSTPSTAGASKSTVYSSGPEASTSSTIHSNLTTGYVRLEQLVLARKTIETWRPWFNELGKDPQKFVDDLLPQLDQSVASLQQTLRAATEAALRVRAGGTTTAAGTRDYAATGGSRGADFTAALANIPATTPAEATITPEGFQALQRMRDLPEKEIPLRVALHAAITRGEYSDQAFAYMLGQLDPATRSELLTGPRGGPSPKQKAFERVRAEFNFRQSVLGVGEIPSIPRNWSPGARMAGRGVAGLMAFLEIWNAVIEPLIQAKQISSRTFTSQNLVPFLRRLLFWQQMFVAPSLVGVDDPTFGSPKEEADYAKVIERLNKGSWDALYIKEPGLSDTDVVRLGLWLSYHIRNFDEFATLFLDSGQDAVTWETPEKEGWPAAQWKVRVGRYETSGENHVEESWYTHPLLTKLMQTYVQRIISNTSQLLTQLGTGQQLPTEMEARLGVLQNLGRPRYTAQLKQPANTTKVYVETIGYQPQWLPREVTWWSPPVFYVYDISGTKVKVSGADYNTYAILRKLANENRQLGMWASGTYVTTTVIGNVKGTVFIPLDLLTPPPAAQQLPTTAPAQAPESGPKVGIGPLNPLPGSDTGQPPGQGGAGIKVEF